MEEHPNNEEEENKGTVEKESNFKKPVVLVGKLGRCPKKLTAVASPTKKKEEAVEPQENPVAEEQSSSEEKPSPCKLINCCLMNTVSFLISS